MVKPSKGPKTVVFEELTEDYGNPYIITVPEALLKDCKTTNYFGKEYVCLLLKAGVFEVKVLCLSDQEHNKIKLSSLLLSETGVTTGTEINVILNNNTLQLGPVIGVFTSNGQIRKTTPTEANFRNVELANANREANTILYFFCLKDLEFVKNKINGTFYNEIEKRWEIKQFPLPDVLYDRGGGALVNQQEVSRFIRKQLDCYNVKKINPQHYFDKWITYKRLRKQSNMLAYLPPTVKYEESKDILKMFEISNAVYLKDANGSNGRGIMRLTKLSTGKFKLSHMAQGEMIEHKTDSFKEVIQTVKDFMRDKSFIIQSAIDLIKVHNRPVDMRATLQRNITGDIEILPSSVRVGREDYPVTSSKSGSSIYTLEEFYKEFFRYSQLEIRDLKETIDAFLFTSFKAIEKAYGIFGEVGIDYALDKSGKIWFIECNAKPGKDCLFKSYGREVIRKAFLNPLQYAKYLMKFER